MRYSIRHLNVTTGDKQKDTIPLLQDINTVFQENEFIGLLGPSGAGKTQLSYALGRLNTFRGNKINCESQTYSEADQVIDLSKTDLQEGFRSKFVGYIFQEAFSYFNPVLKIKSQLEGIETTGINELEDLFKTCGLQDIDRILSSYPHQLSGGQLQRIAIIQCLLRKPSIVIADEIESALDKDNANKIMKLMLELKTTLKFSLIWVTHDQEKAKALCERIWYVEDGRLIYDGPANEFRLIKHYYPGSPSIQVGRECIRLENITKSFRPGPNDTTLNILNSVHCSIFQNEVIGLMGSSGSGKSTLARIIAGLTSPDSGKIFIDGVEIHTRRKPDKSIQYIFQDAYSALNPSWTTKMILYEAIKAGDNAYTLPDLLNKGGLSESILDLLPSALSGGMRQRIAILRAIAIRPKVLILDESLNAMDHNLQVKILNMLINHIEETKMSMIIVSHQENLVKAVSGRIFRIESGLLSLY